MEGPPRDGPGPVAGPEGQPVGTAGAAAEGTRTSGAPPLASGPRDAAGALPAGPGDRAEGAARVPPPYLPAGWRRLHPVARGLMATRTLRSVAQGALATDFVLYLRALHWPAAAIGALLGAAQLAGGALGLGVGPVSDRLGRRPLLLVYQTGLAVCTALVLADPRGTVLVAGALLFGYGLGANGAAGPFSPAEQAWLARHVPAAERGTVFSLNAALGFCGMGVGSIVAGLVPVWGRWLPGPAAFAPLFWLTLAVAAANWWQIARLPEGRDAGAAADGRQEPGVPVSAPPTNAPPARRGGEGEGRPPAPVPADALLVGGAGTHRAGASGPGPGVGTGTDVRGGAETQAGPGEAGVAPAAVRREENRALALLSAVNAVNALGIGIFAPLLPYWFAARYGVGAGAVGSVFAVTFFLTAAASVATGELVARIGLVRSIVALRLVGVALLAAMPFMPQFGWAAALYAVRSVLNRGSVGARQAFGVGLVGDRRRGLASSLNNVSWSLPAAAGPALAGWLMALGSLDLPFYLAAALQLAYAVLFGTAMRRYDPAGPGRRPRAA